MTAQNTCDGIVFDVLGHSARLQPRHTRRELGNEARTRYIICIVRVVHGDRSASHNRPARRLDGMVARDDTFLQLIAFAVEGLTVGRDDE